MFLLDDVLTEYDKAPDDAETADFGAVWCKNWVKYCINSTGDRLYRIWLRIVVDSFQEDYNAIIVCISLRKYLHFLDFFDFHKIFLQNATYLESLL